MKNRKKIPDHELSAKFNRYCQATMHEFPDPTFRRWLPSVSKETLDILKGKATKVRVEMIEKELIRRTMSAVTGKPILRSKLDWENIFYPDDRTPKTD